MEKLSTTKSRANLETNYAIVKFGWSAPFLMPWDDAIKLLECLKHAEIIENAHDNKKAKITPVDSNAFTIGGIAGSTVLAIKTAQLLGISYEEYQNAQSAAEASS